MSIQNDIKRNRFHTYRVRIDTPEERPKSMRVEQLSHGFLFGSNTFGLVSDMPEERREKYKAAVKELWNAGTLPFYWGWYEPEEGDIYEPSRMTAAKWSVENGITTKGHPLCWHTFCADWLLQYDNETILQKQLDRIRREVSRFRGVIDMWDVINEVVIMPVFDKYDNAVSRICNYLGPVELTLRCFQAAREANPDATLLINDFNLSRDYEQLVKELLDRGCPIDAIGLQSHQHQGYHGAEYTLDVIERFSRFEKPLHFTEATILSGELMPPHFTDLNDYQPKNWHSTTEGEERQAEQVEEYYSAIFSHPSTEAIIWWDLQDGVWLNAPSGLLGRDLSPKPAYERLKQLITEEWFYTPQDVPVNGAGEIQIEGPAGTYQITSNGEEYTIKLDDPSRTDYRVG